jgi:hypothetical protein
MARLDWSSNPIISVQTAHFGRSAFANPSRYERKYNTVLISNCGFPDMKQFDALRLNFQLREDLPDVFTG